MSSQRLWMAISMLSSVSLIIPQLNQARLTWRVPLVKQELLTLPEHLSSLTVFSRVRVNRSLVLCVCFVVRCLTWNLVGSIYGRLLITSRSINKHGHHRQFLFLIGRFFKIFSSEMLGQMNRNLVGSIYGRSSIKIAHFVPIG